MTKFLCFVVISVAAYGCPPPGHGSDSATDTLSDLQGTYSCQQDVPMIGNFDAGSCPRRGFSFGQCSTLTIGYGAESGARVITPLMSDRGLVITPGAQGLQHIELGFSATDIDPSQPLLQVVMVRADDCVEVGRLRIRLPFREIIADGQSSTYVLSSVRLLVIDDDDRFEFCSVLDRDVDLIAEISDGTGRYAHTEQRVHINGIDPTIDPANYQTWVGLCNAITDAAVRDAVVTD